MHSVLKNTITIFLLIIAINIYAGDKGIVQTHITLTVSEAKTLIAKAVVQMPMIQQALDDGMIIIARGTTNTYIAQELLHHDIEHGTFVTGRIYPKAGGKKFGPLKMKPEIILVKGKIDSTMSFSEAVTKLQPGDIMIKGANALDYNNKLAGVYIGSKTGGTTGTFMPYVVARKAHLIIPVGLEKLVAGSLIDITNTMQEPVSSENNIPSMFLLNGDIVTEIEAVKILADVTAIHCGGGGIGGAEGSTHLLVKGPKDNIEQLEKIVETIYGAPPFVE